ncbi:MAG: hypothetical protein AMXMBFR53_19980 [Gemmatimonadota bacterium]
MRRGVPSAPARTLLIVASTWGALAAPAAGQEREPPAVRLPQALSPSVPPAWQVADSLFMAGDLLGAWGVTQARLDVADDDARTRVRAVQIALALGIMGGGPPVRLRWLRAADEQGRLLLALRPSDPEAMAWAAASRGKLALAEDGSRTAVRLAEETWRLSGDLLAIAPGHPLGNDVRGKLHHEAKRLSTFKRFVGRVFLGFDLAGEASWADAETHLRRAVEGSPAMLHFHLDLGDMYRDQGKTEEALAAYREGLARPDSLPVDAHLKLILRQRIEEIRPAPGGG